MKKQWLNVIDVNALQKTYYFCEPQLAFRLKSKECNQISRCFFCGMQPTTEKIEWQDWLA